MTIHNGEALNYQVLMTSSIKRRIQGHVDSQGPDPNVLMSLVFR